MSVALLEKLKPRANYDLFGHNEKINFILNSYKKIMKKIHPDIRP